MRFYIYDKYPINKNTTDYIYLIKDNWDDWFTFETTYYMRYVDKLSLEHDIGSVKIGQTDMKEGQRTANIPSNFCLLPENCFSLGQSDNYYENIKKLGDEKRVDILTSLNDIAFNRELFFKVKSLRVTQSSLMRDVSEFTIQNQFIRIANGNARLTPYTIEYTYPKTSNDTNLPLKLTFNVKPNSYPPTNIHVIVGRNNVGKTYLIKNLIKSIYFTEDKRFGVLYSTNSQVNQLNEATYQAFANVLCISFSPFDDYTEIIVSTEDKKNMPFTYIGLTSDKLYDTLCENFLKGLINCLSSRKRKELLEQAIKVLESDPIFEKSEIKSLIKGNENKEEIKDSAETLFKKFSSGHQVIMLTLVQLIEKITEKSLIILDEPENHLHPPLLSAFIRALSELLINRNAVALIATHSPVILQEVPQKCVWKLNRSGSEVRADRLGIESFGATISELTQDVFGLEVQKSGFNKILIDEVNKGYSYDEIIEKFNNELGSAARALLRTQIYLRDTQNETFEQTNI